ncbi:MAG: NnrS family protein [Rubrivivax sp.]|nr:NnrS family protein [Rubrivivax sp.]MCL4699268.1 NnrS family protein [Burkholderiaceae bacterium]
MPPERAAWLAAPFRPFYLLGVAYAIGLMVLAGLGLAGIAPGAFPMAWHGHEMIFGFALSLIAGTALTALPSWAGIAETRGAVLALLAAAWLLGRVACFFGAVGWSWPWPWSWRWVAACDIALPLAIVARLAVPLARLPERRWLAPLAVFGLLALANLGWHAAAAAGDTHAAALALRAALWLVVVMFTLAGGLFTPVFTGNVLAARALGPDVRDRARALSPPVSLPLEVAALAALVALALVDLFDATRAAAVVAPLALWLQAWRVARWRGWRVANDALVGSMHLGFLWLLAALALKALTSLAQLTPASSLAPPGATWTVAPWPEAAWVHAFTVGALGSMALGLMTRVVLRHTGRPLAAPAALPWLLLAVNVAAVLRVAAPALGAWAWPAASALWVAAFAAWLAVHAPMLLRPSLPRAQS